MELTVLGSSSKGNCYILQNAKEALVIECGVHLAEVKRAVGFNIRKIVGAIVTHEHGDHARHVGDFLENRIPVWMSKGTREFILKRNSDGFMGQLRGRHFISGNQIIIGNFTVLPFDVKHDAEEPMGFLINHPETGTILFATDTYYLPYTFENLNNIIIECNYRMDILQENIEAGRIPKTLMNRTLESHMSFDTCKEALLANDLRAVNNIVLIHLSNGNSNEAEFKDDIKKCTGKTVNVASKGLKINFDKTPF